MLFILHFVRLIAAIIRPARARPSAACWSPAAPQFLSQEPICSEQLDGPCDNGNWLLDTDRRRWDWTHESEAAWTGSACAAI